MRNLNDIHNNKIPPFPPAPPLTPPVNITEAIRRYLRARRIWQSFGARYALNDIYSQQIRRDTLRFGIEQKHRIGI